MTVGTGRADDDLLAATLPVLGLALASVAAVRDAAARAGGVAPGPGPAAERGAAACARARRLRGARAGTPRPVLAHRLPTTSFRVVKRLTRLCVKL